MKLKLLFSVVIVCTLLTTSYAQINKGSVWLGSNFSYSQSNDRPEQQQIDREIKTISILPSFGVAIKENLVLGIFGNYTDANKKHDSYIVERKEKTYGGGLFVRRYVPMFKRFYIFGEARLGYNSIETEDHWSYNSITNLNKFKGWETALTFTPGFSYGISQNILLEAGFASLFDVRYKSSKSEFSPNSYSIKQKSFNAGINLENASAFTIGVRFLINKKA